MKSLLIPACLFFAMVAVAGATTWQVGPTRTHTAPSKVSGLVGDGDTVAIDAGVYEADVTRWTASNLVLKGVGGYAHLKANRTSYGGKAIWVITGTNTTVESVEFSLCSCPDNNGAGIRQEGVGLTVRGCYFHNNEDGILAGDNPTSDILIEHCEFDANGSGDGYSHNLYINHVHSLTFQFNYSHHAFVGHELKSRAYNNYILYNRIANEDTGQASREIDLPNGGLAVITGNEIEQGPRGQNSGIIGYGLEGLTNPVSHGLYLINNTIVNDRSGGVFVQIAQGIALYKSNNNIFAGPGSKLSGTPLQFDTAGNLYVSIANARFRDAAVYDYNLLSDSPALDKGVNPDSSPFVFRPLFEYAHPAGGIKRTSVGTIDIGAHEMPTGGLEVPGTPAPSISIRPNPFTESPIISITGITGTARVILCNAAGEQIGSIEVRDNAGVRLSATEMPAGMYYYRLVFPDGRSGGSGCLIRH